MALSQQLKEELTCPVDLEYFKEPMLLKCLHILCEKDVDQMLDQDGLLQCPLCKRVSEKRDIRKDFRTKRLIELLQDDENHQNDNQDCNSCAAEVAICKCQECNMCFGEKCMKAHKKMTGTKEHTIDLYKEIMLVNKEKIQTVLMSMKKVREEYKRAKTIWEHTKDSIDKKSATACEDLDASEKKIMVEVKQVHDLLRQNLQSETAKEISEVDSKSEDGCK